MADRVLRVVMVSDERDLERGYRRASTGARRLDGDFSRLTRGAIVGTGALGRLGRAAAFASGAFIGGASVTVAIRQSITAASDLNEQLSKTRVVFGQSSQEIVDWSKTTAGAFGIAQRQALATASSFGALFKPLGLTGRLAAVQSRQLTELGADLASFYNTDVQDALDAIRSGIVGESEPLRRYGVLLSETRVQAEAMAETGKTNVKALTGQEKALARISLILKDSKVAQGDFARTSGGLANQLRILTANIDNLSGSLGARLLPGLTAAVARLNAFFDEVQSGQNVDSKEIGRRIGSGITLGLGDLTNKIADAVEEIQWGQIGRQLSAGLAEAFLSIKPKDVLVGFVRLNIAIRRALLEFVVDFDKALVAAVSRAFANAGAVALRGILKIIAPLVRLDRFLPGDPFRGLKSALEDAMISMQTFARDGGERVSTNFVDGLARGGKNPAALRQATEAVIPTTVPKPVRTRTGITAAQRNTFFDNLIGRQEDRVQDITSLRGQAAELLRIAGRISAEIARVHDRTRKLTLGDDLVQVQRQRRGVLRQIAEDAKQAAADAKQALEDAKRRAQEARERVIAARNIRQFRALGLTATGDAPIPLTGLRGRLAKFSEAFKGSFLDTTKTRSLLSQIRKLLSGGLGDISVEVRTKVLDILNGLDSQLENHAKTSTKFRVASADALLGGLGLDRDTLKALRQRLARLGPGGTVPQSGRAGAFGVAVPVIQINHVTELDGEVVARNTTRHVQKRNRSAATQTTGPHAGNGSGFVH